MLTAIRYRVRNGLERASYANARLIGLAQIRSLPSRRIPDLAAVTIGRNDDYMPDFAERIRATTEWNTRFAVSEPIFVEWNPPADRPLLSPTLTRLFPSLKAYVVTEALHREVCQNPRLPLMEYHAKNVGIRRAKSPWVLAMNADVALAPDTVLALSAPREDENVVYAAQRIDIPWEEGRREGVLGRDCLRYRRILPYAELGTGDFLLASRELWHKAGGYDEALHKHRIGCDVRGALQLMAKGGRIEKLGTILHLAHPTSCTEGVRPHHGEEAGLEGIPYDNGEDWGLADCRETEIEERVWRLERAS